MAIKKKRRKTLSELLATKKNGKEEKGPVQRGQTRLPKPPLKKEKKSASVYGIAAIRAARKKKGESIVRAHTHLGQVGGGKRVRD